MELRQSAGWLLGALLTGGTAAHDLPRGRAAPPALTGCESLGPGYHKVQGTDTCIRLGGSVQVGATISTSGTAFTPSRH